MTSDQTPDPVEELSGRTTMDMGELLTRAVVHSFFQPAAVGYSMQPQNVQQPNGMMQTVMMPVPEFGKSPLARTADALFEQHGKTITEQIVARIDLDEVAAKVAERVFGELTRAEQEDRGYYTRRQMSPAAENIARLVREKLTDKLADRELDRIAAEQAAMRAAWEREQRRAAEAPPQIEGGAGEHDA